MVVCVTYNATCTPVAQFYNVKKIERDDIPGKKYATMYFDRDEENDKTIMSPLSWDLEKYHLMVDYK